MGKLNLYWTYLRASSWEERMQLPCNTPTASKADLRLGFTPAAVLQAGESGSGYFQALLKTGFTGKEIIEILSTIALNTFSNYFSAGSTTG